MSDEDRDRDDEDDTPADDLPDEPLADLAENVRERTSDDASGGDADEGYSSIPDSTSARQDADPPSLDADRDSPAIDSDADRDPSALPGDTGREGPLGDLAAEVDRRRDEADDAELDDAFTSQDIADLDVDAVWEQVESGGGADAEEPVETEERVVSKASFCQQCEFFSEPPAVGCGHEGTEILELVDTDHFRVRDCPKVAEEERLGDL
ncbi:hypothetical protein ACFQDG_06425 [Natronoarchaeum mannanilyticum]|uniref:DUF8135 domain-containing protein n=1 Tax=Natronoarchaeum mannanilyticum TaxID=926360 RepID=A0AAV3T9D1_9EURY